MACSSGERTKGNAHEISAITIIGIINKVKTILKKIFKRLWTTYDSTRINSYENLFDHGLKTNSIHLKISLFYTIVYVYNRLDVFSIRLDIFFFRKVWTLNFTPVAHTRRNQFFSTGKLFSPIGSKSTETGKGGDLSTITSEDCFVRVILYEDDVSVRGPVIRVRAIVTPDIPKWIRMPLRRLASFGYKEDILKFNAKDNWPGGGLRETKIQQNFSDSKFRFVM